jgi:hypothetical protein
MLLSLDKRFHPDTYDHLEDDEQLDLLAQQENRVRTAFTCLVLLCIAKIPSAFADLGISLRCLHVEEQVRRHYHTELLFVLPWFILLETLAVRACCKGFLALPRNDLPWNE